MSEPEASDHSSRPADPPSAKSPMAVEPPNGEVSGEPVQGLLARINLLNEERKAIKQRKVRVVKDLRNLKRRNARLKKRTKLLSSDDLVEVLLQRKKMEEEEKKNAEEPAKEDG